MDGKKVIIGLAIGLALGLLAGGAVWFFSGDAQDLKPVEPTPIPEEEMIPTMEPTPTPDLDRADLSIDVLNGSGVPGAAGDAEDFLLDLGYEEITTGNADSYDYQQTEVSIKESKDEYLQMLLTDLSSEYTVSSESAYLDEDYDYDVQIIVGTNGEDEETVETEAEAETEAETETETDDSDLE